MTKFTLTTIYQSEITLSTWLNEVKPFIAQLVVIVPIAHRNKIDATGVELPIKWIDIEEENVYADYLQAIVQFKNEWVITCGMNTKLIPAFFEELNSKITLSQNSNKSFVVYPTEVNFIGRKLNYGGFLKEPTIICYHKNNILSSNSISKEKLKYQSTEWFAQTYDNLQLSFIWAEQITSQLLYNQNKKNRYYRFFTVPLGTLIYRWILKGGFLDGKEGFSLSYLYALKGLNRELFLWKKHNNIS